MWCPKYKKAQHLQAADRVVGSSWKTSCDNTEENELNGGTEPRERLSSLLSSLASLTLYSFPENTPVFAGSAI